MIKIMYECPYCDTRYGDEWAAQTCAKDCAIPDDVNEVMVTCCSFCEKEYETVEIAYECESNHKRLDDKYYQSSLVVENFRRLLLSASHVEQTRLF